MMSALKGPGWPELETLVRFHHVTRPRRRGKPFEVLIQTILSQNTNDLNSRRAYESLVRSVGVTPGSLARADPKLIAASIRVGGLYNTKSIRIRDVAAGVLARYPGGLGFLFELDDEGVRRVLSGFKGVGPKTVDIVLDFSLGRDVVPVDTHVNRVSKRLGYAAPGADYDEVRASLEAVIPPGRRLEGHIALIVHGRRVCRAQMPRCGACPVSSACRYFQGSVPGGRAPA
jgi:endonuclease-3